MGIEKHPQEIPLAEYKYPFKVQYVGHRSESAVIRGDQLIRDYFGWFPRVPERPKRMTEEDYQWILYLCGVYAPSVGEKERKERQYPGAYKQ